MSDQSTENQETGSHVEDLKTTKKEVKIIDVYLMTPETVKMLDFFWTLGLGNYFIGLVFGLVYYQNEVTSIDTLMLLLIGTGCAIVRHYGDRIINLISDQIDTKREKKNTFLDKIRLVGNVLGILTVLFCTSQIHGKLPKEISNQILAGSLPGTLICFLISAIKPRTPPPEAGAGWVKHKNPAAGQPKTTSLEQNEENETGFGFSGPSGED